MNILDIVCLLPLTLAVIAGYRKGFIIEIVSFLAFVIAIIACLKLTHKVLELIQPSFGSGKWIPFIAYLITFVLTYLLVIWIGKLLEKVVRIIQLGTLNRALGIVFSLLK